MWGADADSTETDGAGLFPNLSYSHSAHKKKAKKKEKMGTFVYG